MNTKRDFLEVAVIDLTVENAKLKTELEKALADQSRNWNWYMEAQQKANELEKRLDDLLNVNVTE